ncbi:hypothetical protein [Aureimonas pseudogalii]|uniref:Uncharacterized protein n=1 Tax=Aureimonas pseudogalii TaxID=1744844 RepID=A0A7W6H2N7_9HYPH|nr:hypothetical protein [Aureimonas pseudogalii]MBB3997231.1 hypothetical protein [Aureimonas pseudogalii]
MFTKRHVTPISRLVENDKSSVSKTMTTAVAHSRRMLVALTVAHHRGPADTWTAARDRAARAAGIDRTYAARIWSRWQDMKDVSGEALMRLSGAYVALCERSEAIEAEQTALLERIDLETAHEITLAAALERRQQRMAAARASKVPQAPSPSP